MNKNTVVPFACVLVMLAALASWNVELSHRLAKLETGGVTPRVAALEDWREAYAGKISVLEAQQVENSNCISGLVEIAHNNVRLQRAMNENIGDLIDRVIAIEAAQSTHKPARYVTTR